MKILIVFESLFGNTHTIAEAVADGMRLAQADASIQLVHVGSVNADAIVSADLLVVGGPTHNLGMSSATSRSQGVKRAHDTNHAGQLEPEAEAPGVREWLTDLPRADKPAAAFCTHTSSFMAGSAAKGFAGLLKRKGYRMLDKPADFVVTGTFGPLADGEVDRAKAWGEALLEKLGPGR